MWLIFSLINVLLYQVGAEVFRMCVNQRPSFLCKLPENIIRCPDGIESITSFRYLLEDAQDRSICCSEVDDECTSPQSKKLSVLSKRCINNQTCVITEDMIEQSLEGQLIVGVNCGNKDHKISVVEIVYTCSQVKQGSTGDNGQQTTIIIVVTTVIAAVIIAGVVIGLLVYKRHKQTTENIETTYKRQSSRERQEQTNGSFDGEYSTIPGNYETTRGDPKSNDGKTHDVSCSVRTESAKYSTIELINDNTELGKENHSGYDTTNQNNDDKGSDHIHVYSKFDDELNDYNHLNTDINKPSSDKQYSVFDGSNDSDSYSHLNGKMDVSDTQNVYSQVNRNYKKSNLDKEFSSSDEPGDKDNYSHLNDKIDISNTHNIYNHINHVNTKPKLDNQNSRSEETTDIDDYSHLNDKRNALCEQNDYNHIPTISNTSERIEQQSEYEETVLKPTTDASNENVGDTNPSTYRAQGTDRVKRIDSYETPCITECKSSEQETGN